VIYFLVHRSVSKRQSENILELKAQLAQEDYDINKGLTSSQGDPIKVEYHDSKEISEIPRVNAAFFTLVRNEDLYAMAKTVRSYEDRFNSKFHYDWVFVNNEPFDDHFKVQISNLVSGAVYFETVPKEMWEYPDWIDQKKAQRVRQKSRSSMMYGGSTNYRFMCRFFSGMFYKLDRVQKYDYLWRVEPETELLCNVNYDPFKFMINNGKHYGFALSILEFPDTVPTLWDTVSKFIEAYPQFVNKNNLLSFISEDEGRTYNMCHFWTNFEIVDLNFLRSEAYSTFFRFLDTANGFFYERWGDAPVRSIAASLFLSKTQIHHFDDIGYFHNPNHNCPIDNEIWTKNKCLCDQGHDVTFRDYSCAGKFYDVTGRKKPEGWEEHTGKGDYFE
jgi:alpha 1,2-mannosyltransferase